MKKAAFVMVLALLLLTGLVSAFTPGSTRSLLKAWNGFGDESQITMSHQGTSSKPWDDWFVVGDGYRIEFYDRLLGEIKREFQLDALFGSLMTYIHYDGAQDDAWNWEFIQDLIGTSHEAGLPIGAIIDPSTCEWQLVPIDELPGVQYYYNHVVPEDEKWLFPNGTVAEDCNLAGNTRSFSGGLVWRIPDIMSGSSMTIMQPQNPYWLSFLKKWVERDIDYGVDAIHIDAMDLILPLLWGGGWGDNSTWEGYSFIQYLASKYDENTLRNLGISNLDDFCLKEYMSKKFGLVGVEGDYLAAKGFYNVTKVEPAEHIIFREKPDRIMEDTIVKEYLIFQYLSQKNFAESLVDSIKTYSLGLGKEVLVTANHFMGHDTWFPSIVAAPCFDVLHIERPTILLPPWQRNVAAYKIGMAATDYTRPVWIGEMTLHSENLYPNGVPDDASTFLKVQIAEGFASGGVRLIPFWAGSPEEGWPNRRLIEGPERETISEYARFLSANKELMSLPDSTSKVAIVLSVPSAMWDYFPAIGLQGEKHYSEFYGWTKVLEDLHIPYDVVMFGMDPVFDDSKNLERLARYDTAIAPDLLCLSNEQLQALQGFLERGGKLLTTSDIGMKDEMNSLRNPVDLQHFWESPNIYTVESGLGSLYHQSVLEMTRDTAVFNEMSQAVLEILPLNDRISTNAGPEVLLNTLFCPSKQEYAIHIVNYDYNYNQSGDWTSEKTNIKVSMQLPPDFKLDKVTLISPDFQQTLSLEFNCTDTNLLEFTVPTLKVWDIVVLHPSCDLNNDGTVDILDIAIVAKAFGSKSGDQNWNAIADLDKSERVDIMDIAMVAKDFGKTV